MMMAKKIKPRVSPDIPYPGKRPDTLPDSTPEELQVPEEDPDLIIDPDAEEEPEVPFEPAPPGEGP